MKICKISLYLLVFVMFSGTLVAQNSLKRANKQYELSEFAAAVVSYKEVLEKNGNHLESNYRIADCYRQLNQLENALPHYQKAITSGNIPDLYVFQYGLTLQGLGRYEMAQQVFEQLAVSSAAFRTRGLQFAEACKFANSQSEPARFTVKPEYLNTAHADFSPTFFKGERIVYSSARSDVKGRNNRSAPAGNPTGGNRLLITQRDRNGYLESPTTLHSGFGAGINEGPISYTQDGRMVAITKNNFSDGVRQIPSSGLELNLYLAHADENGDWNDAKPFQYNGAGFSNGYPCFSPDGKALFFASDRPGGYGGFDLYVCYKVGDNWSAPENLGQPVNSQGNEVSPFYDGMSLYFSSDFHRGFGGYDIFRAEESAGRWSTIFHTGDGVNSSSDDYGFVFDPLRNVGYFTSNRPGGKGNEDIYKVEKETDNVMVRVTDAATGAPIAQAEIDFTDCGDQSYLTDENGLFNFQLLEDLNCTARIRKKGYLSEPVKITSLGLRQNRNLGVALTSMENAYTGKTINASTGYYLEDVKIIATPQGGKGEIVSAFSGPQGDYQVALQPNRSYLIRYSKAGFQDVTFNFKSSANDSKVIRNIDLLPVGMTASVKPAGAEVAAVETTATPSTTTKNLPSGYSVQVAAVAGNVDIDLSSYEAKLDGLGTVYSVLEDGKTKIRLGVFANRSEAVAAQKKCRAKGYSGAFAVTEDNQTILTAEKPTKTPASTTTRPPSSSAKVNGYLVRLATYGNLDYFDSETVDDIGVITYLPKGKMTIVLLGGYDSRESAAIGLRKAKVRGFPEAHLVFATNGGLEKVK